MKSTGFVRNVDGLGRFMIPKEVRTTLGISEGDAMEAYVDGGGIAIQVAHQQTVGIVRNLDTIGRYTIPMETRRKLEIEVGNPLEVLIDGDRVILRKYAPGCTFCGGLDIVTELHSKPVCSECKSKLANEFIAIDLNAGKQAV